MGVRGPVPKDPKLRQRRNKVATAAQLPPDGRGAKAATPRTPALPKVKAPHEHAWRPIGEGRAFVVEDDEDLAAYGRLDWCPGCGALRDCQGRVQLSADLIEPGRRQWHPQTRAWWRDLWRSPMAGEYVAMDRHGLLRLAHLVDQAHWFPGDLKLEEAIAKQEQRFGLTPIDRRRLQWTVQDPAPPAKASPKRDQNEAGTRPSTDPRQLFALK